MMDLHLKILITIFLGLLFFEGSSQSFAPVGAEWSFIGKKSLSPPSPPCVNSVVYSYKVTHQEQKNGKTVNVLESANSSFYYYEDSARVYFLENDTFHLLVDFSVSIGDTIYTRVPENVTDFGSDCYCPPMFIGDIISVATWDTTQVFQGESLRTIAFDAFTDTSGTLEIVGKYDYTEKIGSYGTGPFGPLNYPILGCTLGFCCNDEKLCYSDSDITIDFSEQSSNCIYTSIDYVNSYNIQTYPNPAHSNWLIQSEKTGILELYSLSGKKMLRKNIHIRTEQINISPLVEGIYFYRISNENGQVMKSGKLVKN